MIAPLLPLLWSCGLAAAGGVGSRVFVVERAEGAMAVYDVVDRELLPGRIEGLGDLHHATMTFSPDLRHGFVASRGGLVSRIDLESLRVDGRFRSSENSIDLAISEDGRTVAIAEYIPGGVTLLDAGTMEPVARIPATMPGGRDSRVTGIVDIPGNRFACVTIEGGEAWLLDPALGADAVVLRVPLAAPMPYDAMVTPDGRHYVAGHLGSDVVSVIDLAHPGEGARAVSLRDPERDWERTTPVKLPHMASWAVAGGRVFVPLVGEKRLAVLDSSSLAYLGSVPVRGHPVYAVRSPTRGEVWVSFTGESDDSFVQVVDARRLEVTDTIEVGGRVYHMDFALRGSVLVATANREERLVLVDTGTHRVIDREQLPSPSGVFGPWRAFVPGL